MRIVVTGGAGFVGSNFVRRILDERDPAIPGVTELVLVDLLTYAGNRSSVVEVLADPRVRFIHGDVRDPDVVRAACAGSRIVVHFAAESHVDRSIENGTRFLDTNVMGSHVLFEAAAAAGAERVVLVSTDEVCGSLAEGEADEDAPQRPNSLYSASKGAAELVARAWHVTHGLPVSTVRACNTYGPFQHPEKLIPRFVTNLLRGEKLPLYGDGRNIREWMHVHDHCQGVALVAQKGRAGETYHLGSGFRTSNLDLTARILRLAGQDWESVCYVPDRKGHDFRYSLATRKIRTELGFRVEVPFDVGLERTFGWYFENRDWWSPLRAGRGVPVTDPGLP
ncbi:dTDP-glucose 4,6-dehydratase [Spiractinospora alimapuensis]|uniref:dTDP-glucose 4,6-dehydratase n=1 Tax=Spiractinospora alimapuensis TaxID=2820884 RepID=UPI001F2736BC|nr:dTDP-glucose 4,6-dehydratase [Spiractinospora alimapuensis]QVQ51828.1 dTDP-glucose 4,6-dehydratase [Spiractinospora alimapuensis]